jgi:hypothetical protein
MTSDEIAAYYAAELQETVVMRRYTGGGTNRPRFDVEARGKAWGYRSQDLVGSIQQGDQRVVVLADDLIAGGFVLPVTTNDRVVVKGRELSIIDPGFRKAPDGTVVTLDLQARG